jgi:hypothetical protein
MKSEIESQLSDAATRLRNKGLFVPGNDSLSMRIPGSEEFLLIGEDNGEVQTVTLDSDSPHAGVYRGRSDAGAVLIGTTNWSVAISAIGNSPPIMYDEQARHIGKIPPIVADGDNAGLGRAVATGSNIIFYADQCIRIGMTRDRVVFNAELFEKCAMAFVVAHSSGGRIKKIPGWVQYIAGGRLRKDQKRASESYAIGKIPEGMNAY